MPTSARAVCTVFTEICGEFAGFQRADVHPQGVGRIRSAPSSLTAALAIGPYNMLCNIIITQVSENEQERNCC